MRICAGSLLEQEDTFFVATSGRLKVIATVYVCCFRQLVIQMTCVCLLLVASGGGATSPAHPLP